MTPSRLLLADALRRLPPERPADLLTEIRQEVRKSRQKVVALEDHPTGTQTAHRFLS
jgi:hypothetical protein